MTSYTATYSPEDNKLRLYAASRLPPDLFARVKAAGFKWAPKQELFVAPMWTPERAALLEELAGDIGDEDTSLVERAETRAARFDEYSDKRGNESRAASEAVRKLADGIPLGQPILIGHHSERHARRDAQRIENGMRKAVKLFETAEYWVDRAAGALAHAKYAERPDVRTRRIRKIEADLRKVTRNHQNTKAILAAWGRLNEPGFLKRKATGEESTPRERALYLAGAGGSYFRCYPAAEFRRPDGVRVYEGEVSIWSAITDGIVTPEWARDWIVERQRAYIEVSQRWIDHYTGRLSYERAMLGQSGGIPAQKIGPEKGGAAQCWASRRGCWSYIVKVNKVTVTVLDNWRNGGKNFARTIPLDKLTALMSAADVAKARTDGRLVEADDKTGFGLRDELLAAAPVVAPSKPDDEITAMRASLKAGVNVAVAPQLFPTPPVIAARMVELAGVERGTRVLDPSAGTGRLLEAARAAGGITTAVEINYDLVQRLRATFDDVRHADFLQCTPEAIGGPADVVLMNPPFEAATDIKHIRHAFGFVKPGGRLVALCANGPRQARELGELAEEHGGTYEPLPDGTFSQEGTLVRVAMIVIEKAA